MLLAAGSLAVMPGAVIAPVLPEIKDQLRLDTALAGYLVSAHYLTVAICSPLLGILADRIGQVRVLVVALIGFALSGVAGAFTHSFLPMLVTRGLLGAATGGIAAGSLGLLAKMYSSEEKRSQAIAYASSTLTLSNIVYPLLAGWVGSNQWQFAFYLYGLGVPLGLLAAFILPEQRFVFSEASVVDNTHANPREAKQAADKKKLGSILRNPQILRLMLTVGLTAATAYATVVYLPSYLNATIDSTTVINGLVLACQAIGAAIISAFGVSLLMRRLGSTPTLAIGLSLMAIALITIPQLEYLHWLMPTALLFGIGMGITIPGHYVTIANLAPTELQTTTLAIATGMNFLGQFLSPTFFGFAIYKSGLTAVFYTAASVALLTILFLLLTSNRKERYS